MSLNFKGNNSSSGECCPRTQNVGSLCKLALFISFDLATSNTKHLDDKQVPKQEVITSGTFKEGSEDSFPHHLTEDEDYFCHEVWLLPSQFGRSRRRNSEHFTLHNSH
jgi:hypothetical protein